MKIISRFFIFIYIAASCTKPGQITSDPLPSWNDSPEKTAILEFVKTTTDPNSVSFIPEKDRITVFDNDGTLWTEKPFYFQFEFAFDMVKLHAGDHPEWKEEQPFKGILENDQDAVWESGTEGIGKLLAVTHTGMSNEEFTQTVSNWIDTAHHKQSGRLYREMVFQPMLEVLIYLRANGFKTYIVSGGSIAFMQPFIEQLYGIPTEQVLGTRFKMEYEVQDGNPVLMRIPEMEFFNDKGGKVVNISQIIGKVPVAAFGNSDGDLAMLQYTDAGDGERLMVYIHHTDSIREYAYDRNSHVGKLNKGLDEATAKGWTVVDMKNDWKVIYPN
jgi:phosphoserine phosphatase